eukprot:6492472-Amphidinium_carterae.1
MCSAFLRVLPTRTMPSVHTTRPIIEQDPFPEVLQVLVAAVNIAGQSLNASGELSKPTGALPGPIPDVLARYMTHIYAVESRCFGGTAQVIPETMMHVPCPMHHVVSALLQKRESSPIDCALVRAHVQTAWRRC